MTIPVSTYRRRIVDGNGTEWLIWEEFTAHVPGARAPRALTCDSPMARRRVWDYPPDWYELSDAELLELCVMSGSTRRKAS